MSLKNLSLQQYPIRALRFMHVALLNEVNAIVDEASKLDASGAPAHALAERIALLAKQSHIHTSGEEVGLFPLVAEHWPDNDKHYLFDHQEERTLYEKAEGAAHALENASGDLAPALRELRQATSALAHHMSLHIRKEDEIVFPMIEGRFDPPKQGEIVRNVFSVVPPPEVPILVLWIFRQLDQDGREAFVRMRMAMSSPAEFEPLKQLFKGGISADHWADLTLRIPALN